MTCRPARLAALCALTVFPLIVPRAASADFFDDARRTFTTDIPHFFQDDVPCTFGGQPTSGARRACKEERPAPAAPAQPAPHSPAPSRPAPAPVRR